MNLRYTLLSESDHQAMTLAAVNALSSEEQGYLEPEAELLISTYCQFPDWNWACYGEWGGWSGYPNDPRLPDLRREWNISEYRGHNPVTGEGHRFGHSVPASYDACPRYFALAVEAFRDGRHADAVRLLGIMAHHAEDSVTFGHMQGIHRRMVFDYTRIDIRGYEPDLLATTAEEAAANVRSRIERAVAFTDERALAIRAALRENRSDELDALFAECDDEGARMVADYLRTAIHLGGPKVVSEPGPAGENLVANPSFEEGDGTGVPAGWVVGWYNLRDPAGRWEWDGAFSREKRVSHSGRRSAKLMWTPEEGMEWRQRWPNAIAVEPGQCYRVSGWVKTQDATGESCLVLCLYRRNNALVAEHRSELLTGTSDWRRVSFDVDIEDGAEKARIACRSDGNQGAVWFDDVSLVTIDGLRQEDAVADADRPRNDDDLLLHLRFDGEGSTVADASRYARFHGPIVCLSAGTPADLHCDGGRSGRCLAFDGVDDFVELPRWKLDDQLHPEREMTVLLWVWIEEWRLAYLLAKESVREDGYVGYRLALNEDGRFSFTVGVGGQAVSVSSPEPVPVQRWALLGATSDVFGRQRLFVDGQVVAEAECGGELRLAACDRDLYLAADYGVDAFFRGRVDEVRIYNRALSAAEISRFGPS